MSSVFCFFHPERGANARCPDCNRFYCRECVVEHDDHVLCAGCLKLRVSPKKKKGEVFAKVWSGASFIFWFFGGWSFFYLIARLLVLIPSSFHDGLIKR